MVSKRSKIPLVLVFICSLTAVGLSLTAAATSRWINAVALRKNLTDSTPPDVPGQDGLIPPYTGYIQFGLFNGQKIFNYAFTQRAPESFSIFEEHQDVYSIVYPVITFVLLLVCGIFGLVSAVFGLVNVLTVPIETIHGPIGLYIWNGIGAVSSILALVIYLVLYQTQLIKNVLIKDDIDPPNNFQTHDVYLGYSYWLVVGCSVLFVLCLGLVFLARLLMDPDFLRQKKREMDIAKGVNNMGLDDIMY